MSVNLNFCF